jgi:hypothetical protein
MKRQEYIIDMEYFLDGYKEQQPTAALFIQLILERCFKYYDIKYVNNTICGIINMFPKRSDNGTLEIGERFFPYSVSADLEGDEKNE